MPSRSLVIWRTTRSMALAEIRRAHQSVGGTGPGRRFATQQINQAYAVLLCGQFQGFCRDLHSECAGYFVQRVPAGLLRTAIQGVIAASRSLDRGNPSPDNIVQDFSRFGLAFRDELRNIDPRNERRLDRLRELLQWRNAIAHQDFDPTKLGSTTLRLQRVIEWQQSCNQLAASFDEVMKSHLYAANDAAPW